MYLEGDGLAWRNRYQMSANPTPANPLALGLALIDPAPHVAYLARPCQFVSDANSHGCDGYYWTNGRYSQAVITATSAALDQLKAQAKAQSLVLVGYSGGATVALLVAAQRRDIAQVITVAGNLNPDAWTQLHQVSPLTGSLNPMNYLPQLRQIPQIHFVGMQDTNTPPALAQEFMQQLHQASPEQTSVTQELILLPNYTHDCCWSKDWPARISQARRNTY